MESLKKKITETRAALDDENIEFDYETELLEKLPGLILREAQDSIKEIDLNLCKSLTEKQKEFYIDIHDFLKNWIDGHINDYLNLSYEDQQLPTKEGVKITIKRIKELLTASYTKNSFSNLVDEFKYIKSGDTYNPGGKYDRLRNDFN